MEVFNYDYGVKFVNITAGIQVPVARFYPKNAGRLTYYSDLSFLIADSEQYQVNLSFIRQNITLINSKGVVVPLPATDDALFNILASFLYSNEEIVVGNIVPITGANYLLTASDSGRTFLFDEPPSIKTFTIPAGLPANLRCTVIKMYSSNAITFVGSGGMIVSGSDLTLNGQYSRMEVIITGPTSSIASNTGG